MNATPPGLSPSDAERFEDLLADRAVFGLSPAETAELATLMASADQSDDSAYDLIAASILPAVDERLPAVLRERVLDDQADHQEQAQVAPKPASAAPVAREWPVYTMLAVAAGVMLSIYLGGLPGEPTAAGERVALIATTEDLVQVAWAPQDDPSLEPVEADGEAVYGDVVWSDSAQSGYMRFRGLKPNDPTVEQYQLWVFDEARNAEHPVDGGVFDIVAADLDEAGEIVVPINAKLPISKATLFAITVEKPGGVVVSDRSRLPLLASR